MSSVRVESAEPSTGTSSTVYCSFLIWSAASVSAAPLPPKLPRKFWNCALYWSKAPSSAAKVTRGSARKMDDEKRIVDGRDRDLMMGRRD